MPRPFPVTIPCWLMLMVVATHLAAVQPGGREVQVADGLMVELIAAPPLVRRPVSLAFDEVGLLYVTDSSGRSLHGKELLRDTDNRVLRLSDADGDGRYDHATVFADGLTFPEGCLWHDGALYVGTPPTITRLKDSDGDGVADERTVWYDGKTLTGCANDLHGPYLGADGWFYWCKGAFDEQRHVVDGKPWHSRAAHIFRCRADGSGFEPVMTGGMDNPVDVVQTSRGQRFFTTTFFQHPEAGRRDGLIHAVAGGVWGKDHDVLRGHRRTGDLMPPLIHLGAAAPCGLEVLAGTMFGADAPDSLVACQFNLRTVSQHVLVPHGASFTTRDRNLLWSRDRDFHPTDVVEDADGSLVIADTGGWYKICCPTSQLARPEMLGALYRVRPVAWTPVADPRGLHLDWSVRDAAVLGARLADPRPAVQRRAQALIASLGDAAVPAVQAVATRGDAATKRRALWTLARIADPAASGAVRDLLRDDDTTVQETAAMVVALTRDAAATAALTTLANASDAGLRRTAVEALARAARPTPAVIASVRGALGDSPDRFMDHAVTWAQQELLLRDETLAGTWFDGLPSQDTPAGTALWRTALIALDQTFPARLLPERVLPLLDHPHAVLRDTARWIMARRGEWGEALTATLLQRVREPGDEIQRTALQRLLTDLAPTPTLTPFFAAALADRTLPTTSRLLVATALAEVSLRQAPAAWAEALAGVLQDDDPALLAAAIATASRLRFAPREVTRLSTALRAIARDVQRTPVLRVQAYAAIPGRLGALDDADLALLTSHVSPAHAVAVRAAAVRALAAADLTLAQFHSLLPVLREAGPLELERLLALYQSPTIRGDEELGLALIAALRRSRTAAALRPDQVRAVAAAYPPTVQAAAQSWSASLAQDAAMQAKQLDDLLGTLPTGDASRGQAVFNDQRAACTTCHLIGHVGGRIGPDLTGVGKVRSRRDLLEAVVFPSASFVRSYEPWMVTTNTGEFLLGTIKNEGDDFMVLNVVGGIERRLGRNEITELKPAPTSLMPAGLDRALSAQELADLLSFLESRRG